LATLRLLSKVVPEYSYSLDEEGICKTAFELIFAFDEVISLGHKENITVTQVKQYCEMDSLEERNYNSLRLSKVNETNVIMKQKAYEIDKSKIEKSRGDKGGFRSIQSTSLGRIDSGFNDMSISSGGGGGGFGPSVDTDIFSTKPKGGRPAAAATAPSKVGMQLVKSQKENQFLESLKAEGEVIIEDVRPVAGQSRAAAAAAPLTDPVTLTVEEKLNVTLKREGGVSSFDVQGTLSLQILNQEDGLIQVQVETGGNQGVLFKTHPNINKDLFAKENILGLKDQKRPFPTGQSGDGVGLLRWRMQTVDESIVPLTISCWPTVSGNETYVCMDYEASSTFDLQNVVISVPLPALREAPKLNQIDGEWRYDAKSSVFLWSILLIDNSNRSGSMEFIVPAADSSIFFPVSVRFTASDTFSGVKVTNILPLRDGNPPKFSQRTQLITENYQLGPL
jgi:hypothetical protein